jgi:hypothetical protein
MDALTLFFVFAVGGYLLRSSEQRQRIALLSIHLGRHQIEKLMERLNEGYMRALGESDPHRQAQIWSMHEATEQQLGQQFQRFSDELSQADEVSTRVNRNLLPHAHRWLPPVLAPGFDLREVMRVHARGIAQTLDSATALEPRVKARTLLAELYLMQHSCHWYCRSRNVASARLLARHQTSYKQLLDAVSPATRDAYLKIVLG